MYVEDRSIGRWCKYDVCYQRTEWFYVNLSDCFCLQLVRLLFWNRFSTKERVDLDLYEEDETREKDSAFDANFKVSRNKSNKIAPVNELGNGNEKEDLDDDTGIDGSQSKTTETTATNMDSATGFYRRVLFYCKLLLVLPRRSDPFHSHPSSPFT